MFRATLAFLLVSLVAGLSGCTVPLDDPQDICTREKIDAAERERLRKRPDFDLILDYALANCPEIALQLVGPDTGTIVPEQQNGEGGNGGGIGGGDNGGGDNGGGDNGGGDNGGGDNGGGDNGGGDDGGGDDGGGDDGGGGTTPLGS